MSLGQKLDALRNAAQTKIPAEARAIMHRATDDLRRSGIADRVIKVGQTAPAFELLNQRREPVSSRSLLARGPLVVSVYRGVW